MDLFYARQARSEVVTWEFDYGPRMRAGENVVSAIATVIPPSGTAPVPVVGGISNNIVPVTVGPLSLVGKHFLDVLATTSLGDQVLARLELAVEF